MMRFSSTGVYIPYFGEGYTANNLLPFEKPFTLAHEMVHGYGITDEGAANFLAFLACEASAVPFVKYSGYAAYWEYAAGELTRAAPSEFKLLWEKLPEGMKADLRSAQMNAARYRGALEKVSQKVYAKYLKSQGINDGLKSYSRFVGLVAAWKKKNGLQTRAVLIGKRILKPIVDPERDMESAEVDRLETFESLGEFSIGRHVLSADVDGQPVGDRNHHSAEGLPAE